MALRSMTAYGRATLTGALGRFIVELQSLNRKHLDLSTQLPSELLCFEGDIKKWISNAISRGQLSLKLTVAFEQTAPLHVRANLPLVKQLKAAWESIASECNIAIDDHQKLQILAGYDDVILYENVAHEDEALRTTLHNVVNMALEKLILMKVAEGAILSQDISKRLLKLESLLEQVNVRVPQSIERYREKLKGRLEELLSGTLDIDERILREVGMYADRIDITEEIVRFNSHLRQFATMLNGSPSDVGKTLDFLIQEMKREVNTIGSKSLEIEIAQLVIEMKTEIERIREQIQNIE